MIPEMFDEVANTTLFGCKTMLTKKKGYGTNEDRLSNFKQAGHLQKIKPTSALMGMLAKHSVALNDYMSEYERTDTLPPAEELEEKITDSINYLLLLKGLLIDAKILPYIVVAQPKNKK